MKTKRLTILILSLCIFGALMPAHAEGFKIRGIKGLWWEGIEKYNLALPWLARHNLNFLMLCYTSFPASGTDWRADYTNAEKAQIKELAQRGKALGVEICLSFNPGIWSNPPLVYSSDQDCKLAFQKVRTVHELGVRWFALCLDDINRALQPEDQSRFGNLAAAQVYFVNRLWEEMKALKPRPRLIFCPSAYTTADMREHLEYTKTIGNGISREVMMFWTGPQVCSPSITASDARLVAQWLKRKPFVWDNYPVNDMFAWRPLLSPLKNRSSDLKDAVCGYIANPMKQWHLSTIPLTSTASYLTNPEKYDAERAKQQIIESYPRDQQRAIRLLLHLYGDSFWGEPGFPPKPEYVSRDQAQKDLHIYRALRTELMRNAGLSDLWLDIRDALESDITFLEKIAVDRRATSPLKASGIDFEGGAASVFGWLKYDKLVNYVYAKSTGRNEMHTSFYLSEQCPKAILRLTARNDDWQTNGTIEIMLDDYQVYAGPANFPSNAFETKEFTLPGSILKVGENLLRIRMTEQQGALGMPPWFMVSDVELIPLSPQTN